MQAMRSPTIAVLGSANIDFVLRIPRFPEIGETLHATDSQEFRGGKGANQAVAAARLGADVRFYGKVGDDAHGDSLLTGFREEGINADAVETVAGSATGTAMIWVAEDGENAIVVSEGANAHVDAAYVDRYLDEIARVDVLLMQLEIPLETIAYVLRALPPKRPSVILNPAPAAPLEEMAVARISCLTPNEDELRFLAGMRDIQQGAGKLHEQGAELVVCTMGSRGARVMQSDGTVSKCEAFTIDAVDTTACGDAFSAALSVGLARGEAIDSVVRDACACGALAAREAGAWPSLPTAEDVRMFLEAQSHRTDSSRG